MPFYRGAGGGIFEIDVPTDPNLLENHEYHVAKGNLVELPADSVEWYDDFPEGMKLRVKVEAEAEAVAVARPARRRGQRAAADSPADDAPAEDPTPEEG